jgi:hypothetical protein
MQELSSFYYTTAKIDSNEETIFITGNVTSLWHVELDTIILLILPSTYVTSVNCVKQRIVFNAASHWCAISFPIGINITLTASEIEQADR